MSLSEGGTLEFPWPNLGDVVGQRGPYGFFKLHGFNHLYFLGNFQKS
jgi:hypothetical protein